MQPRTKLISSCDFPPTTLSSTHTSAVGDESMGPKPLCQSLHFRREKPTGQAWVKFTKRQSKHSKKFRIQLRTDARKVKWTMGNVDLE